MQRGSTLTSDRCSRPAASRAADALTARIDTSPNWYCGDAGMRMEDVQIEAGDDGITKRVLLEQKRRIRAGCDVVPGAPFVYRQRLFLLPVSYLFITAPGFSVRFVNQPCCVDGRPRILAKSVMRHK